MNRLLAFFAFICTVASQGGGLIQPITLMSSLTNPTDGTYTIGYIDLPTSGNPSTGMPPAGRPTQICKQVSIFKFPAAATGTATTLTLMSKPQQPSTCTMLLTLYSDPTGSAIGSVESSPFTTAVNGGGATGSGPGAPSITNVPLVFDLTGKGWGMTRGQQYYIGFRTSSVTADSTRRCNVTIPWGPAPVPQWAVVTQNGPVGQFCGATPWRTDITRDGAAVLMAIVGTPNVPSTTATTKPSSTAYAMRPSQSQKVTPSSSLVATQSATGSASQTSTGSPSQVGTQTATPAQSATGSMGVPSLAVSQTQRQTQTQTATQTPGPTQTPSVTASATKQNPGNGVVNGITGANAPSAPSTNDSPSAAIIAGSVSSTVAILGMLIFAVYYIASKQQKLQKKNVVTSNPISAFTNTHITQNTQATGSTRAGRLNISMSPERETSSFRPITIRTA